MTPHQRQLLYEAQVARRYLRTINKIKTIKD